MTPSAWRRVASAVATGLVLTLGNALLGDSPPVSTKAVDLSGSRPPSPPVSPTAVPILAPTPTRSAALPVSSATPTAARPARRSSVSKSSAPKVRSTGVFWVVPGPSAVGGTGPIKRYRVEVERGLVASTKALGTRFATAAQRTLSDPRGWGHGGRMSFQRVSGGPVAFTIVLAGPATTDRLCQPLRTRGVFSCYDSRGRAVINYHRWTEGARSYAGHLTEYRQYVISHEVGHALGHGHESSCRKDGLAPTMMQQTKSLYGCKRNAWPYPST